MEPSETPGPTRPPAWVLLSLALLLLLVSHPLWLAPLGRFLVVDARPGRAEAVVPLAGEPQRALYASELLREGHARLLLVTPLPGSEGREAYRREVTAITRSRGVPADAVVHLRAAARSTHEEARNLRRFVEARGIDSLLVVTSPWHTRRSSLVFARVFRDSPASVQVVPLPARVYDLPARVYRPDAWWRYAASRRVTVSEYLKLVAHVVGVH